MIRLSGLPVRIQLLVEKNSAMAFADPQSVTINAIANSLPRVSLGLGTGIFQKDDGLVVLTVSSRGGNSKGPKRRQTRARLDHSKVGPDPFNGALNAKYGMSVSIILDTPTVGYTLTEQKQVVDALIAWASATSGANITRLLGGEV